MKLKCWIEAMRLRTLPVSVAGVFMAVGYAVADSCFRALPAALCLVFAVLAQIASNFANEYYDYKAGLDAPGREGPRRGVTEGDISPRAMARATYLTLALACAVGLSLIYWGGWWLISAGVFIALGVLSYSAGPYPLSHHALGEIAVIFFFGIIPVNLTYYLMSGTLWSLPVFCGSLSAGLLGANVLIVNNYRDADDDAAVGKTTLAVKFGRSYVGNLYLFFGFFAVAFMAPEWLSAPIYMWILPVAWLAGMVTVWWRMMSRLGRALNPLLGMTAALMLLYALLWLATAFTIH